MLQQNAPFCGSAKQRRERQTDVVSPVAAPAADAAAAAVVVVAVAADTWQGGIRFGLFG